MQFDFFFFKEKHNEMLKSESLNLYEPIQIKCAEIHYQQRDFSIVCICCDLTTTGYQHFISHFLEMHVENFQNNKLETPEATVDSLEAFDSVNTTNSEANDPLDVDEHVSEKQEQPEGDEVKKQETCSEAEVVAGKTTNTKLAKQSTRILRSASSKNTKKKNSKKLARHLKHDINHDSYENASESTSTAEVTAALVVASPDDSDGSNSASDAADSQDIDWSKTFQPKCDKTPYKPRDKPNLCIYCGRIFKRRRYLEAHVNIHTGLKPHQCDLCGRTFRHLTTLEHHLKTHDKRDTFPCHYCDKILLRYSSLIAHEKQHTQQRTVPCEVCKKLFFTINQMDLHRRKVHPESIETDNDANKLPFLCDICQCRFRTQSYLCTHKKEKHYRTSKLVCGQCGKKLGSELELTEHMQIHAINYANEV